MHFSAITRSDGSINYSEISNYEVSKLTQPHPHCSSALKSTKGIIVNLLFTCSINILHLIQQCFHILDGRFFTLEVYLH